MRVIEALVTALRDKGRGVSDAAEWALMRVGDAHAVEPLQAALQV